MTYIRFFFVLYWFAPFLKFGPLPSENPRCAPAFTEEIFNGKLHFLWSIYLLNFDWLSYWLLSWWLFLHVRKTELQNGDIELVRLTWVPGCYELQKVNVRFETSIFEIGCRQNFVKIRKLILFDAKWPYLGIWDHNFQKPMSDLKSAQWK